MNPIQFPTLQQGVLSPRAPINGGFRMLDYTPNTSLTAQLCQPETLYAAWRKVRANKGGPGSDGVTIQQFEANLMKHLRQLSREIAEERYYPLPIQKLTIKKENGSTRALSVLTLKEWIPTY